MGLLVLGNVDNVVRPLLLAGKSQVNTLVLIISLMGGVSAFGFIGIVLGPLVAVLLDRASSRATTRGRSGRAG